MMPPVATDDSYSVDEDTTLNVTAPGVIVNDSDVEGNTLTALLDTSTSSGTLTLNADGSFTYTPSGNFNGTDSFTYHANDGTADSNVATVTITVDPVNDAPIVSNIFDQTIVEGTNLYHHITLDGQVTDVDNTDDQITWTATGNTQLTVTIDASRVATIATPNADWNGAETITFRATDPGSAFAEDGRNL